jgi:hypothetical protein
MLLAARRCLGRMDVATRPALRAPNEPELIVEPVSGPGTEQLLLDDQLGVGGPTGPEIQRPPRGRRRPDPLAASRPRRRNRCRGARDPAAGRGPAGSVSAAQPYPIPIRRLSCSAPPVVVQHAAPPTARSRPDDPCSAPPVVPRHPAPPHARHGPDDRPVQPQPWLLDIPHLPRSIPTRRPTSDRKRFVMRSRRASVTTGSSVMLTPGSAALASRRGPLFLEQ